MKTGQSTENSDVEEKENVRRADREAPDDKDVSNDRSWRTELKQCLDRVHNDAVFAYVARYGEYHPLELCPLDPGGKSMFRHVGTEDFLTVYLD